MNFETRSIDVPNEAGGQGLWAGNGDSQRNRKRIIAAVVIALAALAVGWAIWGGSSPETATGTEAKASAVPTVTVIVPGRSAVERVITANGTLAARREMPVGVAGEGGQVVRVLVEPGQWVGAGQVLATIDRSVQIQQIEQLAAQIRVAEADARLAQAELDRAQALISRGFISNSDLDRRTASRDAAVARVRVTSAQLAEARARTGRLDIRAPAAGLVLTRGVEPGQIVSPGSGVLFRIARGGEMELLARIGEAELTALSTGVTARVTPVGSDSSFTGQIWQISPVIDPQSRQGTARIALAYSPALRPGGFAEASIVAGQAQAPQLPESSVLTDDQGQYVYVVGNDNKVRRRVVTVGPISQSGVPVLSGLSGQERVVLSAGAFLSDGDEIKPVVRRPAATAAPAPSAAR
ncbi:efflux RND transporter periplasmic adaptor subunit [Sphingomonas lacunae]|uniref:Efflux RND transporter periplasmic adaptor subunit n=1 Tax=Sphingomonas lacunae TaxID=2698828 RepID=A0A6M4AR17_9SPHN|nr:efflux RND transporter periplasmic adaptor subunit [Sphingomonas lacunae]QJQ31487.1 efflux RND transporter periplasmic adaptor subunit [Sphingomonas lacunae]